MEFIAKERSLEEVKEMGYAIALYPVVAFDCAIQGEGSGEEALLN